MMKNRGQLAMEFLLFMGVAFFVVIVLLISALSLSKDNTKIKAYHDVDDLGIALQQEFLLAAQMEDGYARKINLPLTVDGLRYSISLGQSNPRNSYFILSYEGTELFYMIPPIAGNITLGDNVLSKSNNTLMIHQ